MSLVVVGMMGCSGTEGGNPLDERDGGPSLPDSSVCSDSDAAFVQLDGGVVVRPTPLCEPGVETSGCTCVVGEALSFSESSEGSGQRSALYGPTTSGGFVALHTRNCIADCTDTRRAILELHRFDAAGLSLGAPIEITRSSAWVEQGAVLVEDTLTLVFADERAGPSGDSALYFGRIDVASGAWVDEPRVALSDAGSVSDVQLAQGATGYGVVYTTTRGSFFSSLSDDGAAVGEVVRVGDPNPWSGSPAVLVRSGEGFLFGGWAAGTLKLVSMNEAGAETSPPTVITNVTRGPLSLIVRPSGTGYLVAWSEGTGVHVARTDGEGRFVGAPIEVADGTLREMVERSDGNVALLWIPRSRCGEAFVEIQEWVLTQLDPSGTRAHPDVLIHRGTGSSYGGDLVETSEGLRASVVTYGPETSTAWTMPACVP